MTPPFQDTPSAPPSTSTATGEQRTLLNVSSSPVVVAHDHSNKHPNTTSNPASWKTKKVVRAMLVVTAVAVGVLLLRAGPSKMMTMNKSRNIDGMVVDSCNASKCKDAEDDTPCLVPPYGEAFSGLSCKDSDGFCAGGGEAF